MMGRDVQSGLAPVEGVLDEDTTHNALSALNERLRTHYNPPLQDNPAH